MPAAISFAGCLLVCLPAPPACLAQHPLLGFPIPPADDIRERVKALGFDRHKLVVHVTTGELKQQAFSCTSRCLWDTASDGLASETYLNETLFCSAQVYALYFE